jgi:hypothetical protein
MNIPVETIIQYGLPTALLSVLVIGLWRGGHKIAGWVKPVIENVTNKHLELVDTLKTNSTETKNTLASIETHMEIQSGILKEINNKTIECPYKVEQKKSIAHH